MLDLHLSQIQPSRSLWYVTFIFQQVADTCSCSVPSNPYYSSWTFSFGSSMRRRLKMNVSITVAFSCSIIMNEQRASVQNLLLANTEHFQLLRWCEIFYYDVLYLVSHLSLLSYECIGTWLYVDTVIIRDTMADIKW